MMNPAHILTALQRACRYNPSARRATIWQVAKDANGVEQVTESGQFIWHRTCLAWVTYTFRKEGEFAGVTGDFEGGYKVTVLPDPVRLNPFELPALGQSFIIRRNPRMIGDPIPEAMLITQKIGADAMGLVQTFACREPDEAESAPVLIGPLAII